jgi:MSHA biogenesis protein MshI
MLGFLKKRLRSDALAAICPGEEGIAVARVCRGGDIPPVLEFCHYHDRLDFDSNEKSLKLIADKDGLEHYTCVSTMDLGSYSLLMVEAPDVQADELRAAVRWRIKDLIDFPIDDSVVDIFEVPDAKASGQNKMLYVVVARSESVKQKVDTLLDADINLSVIDIPEMALRNIASLLPEDVAGMAMLYIGRDSGLITVTQQSKLYLSRRIGKGLDSLPDTIMQDNDPETTRVWLDNIIIELQRSLDYYERHFSNAQVSGIVITPLSRHVEGIDDYIASQTGLPVRILDINSLIDVHEGIDQSTQSNCIIAIGAALRDEAAAA